jgi:hypothetical protein
MVRWSLLILAFTGCCLAFEPCPDTAPVSSAKWVGSALHQAILRDDVKTVEQLLQQRAKVDERDSRGNTPLVNALTPRAVLEPAGAVSAEKRRSRIESEQAAQRHIVVMLLTKQADPNTAGLHGRTPLMQLSGWGFDTATDLKLAKLLIEHGARVDARDQFGSTALMLAAQRGKMELVQFLLDRSADRTIRNCHGQTAASLAKASKHTSIERLLER